MARKSIIAAAALASLAVAFVPAAASAKKDSFGGSGIKIDVKPRIKRDIGLHVRCRREPTINELGVRFTRHTNCVLWGELQRRLVTWNVVAAQRDDERAPAAP